MDQPALSSIYMGLAVAAAEEFIGATSPNPPVGACVVKDGQVLAIEAHQRVGTEHAEARALRVARERYGTDAVRGAHLFVTLEPCNHQGRTPPCTNAIHEAGIEAVVFGLEDPNPSVKGGGAAMLREAGIPTSLYSGDSWRLCRLVDGFSKYSRSRLPWLVHKLAYRLTPQQTLTLVPEAGQKTFTTPESLRLAHEERRKADAILTGMGTVLADRPRFNVRHVTDHPDKKRIIAVVSRSGQPLPADWLALQKELGQETFVFEDPARALLELGQRGCLRVLAEAGPALSAELERLELWDERLVLIHQGERQEDTISREYQCSRES